MRANLKRSERTVVWVFITAIAVLVVGGVATPSLGKTLAYFAMASVLGILLLDAMQIRKEQQPAVALPQRKFEDDPIEVPAYVRFIGRNPYDGRPQHRGIVVVPNLLAEHLARQAEESRRAREQQIRRTLQPPGWMLTEDDLLLGRINEQEPAYLRTLKGQDLEMVLALEFDGNGVHPRAEA